MRRRQGRHIEGAGGVRLYVEEFGVRGWPGILLIHGFSQCRLAWRPQTCGFLADRFHMVAMDLRGHGRSDKPDDEAAYTTGALWADDVAAVIDRCGLDRPVLAGWSYGGFVICDYVRRHGEGGIGGINFIGAATMVGTDAASAHYGADFLSLIPGFFSTDVAESIPALDQFMRLTTHTPQLPADHYTALGYTVIVPPHTRRAMFRRRLDNDDVLQRLTVPVLITHGSEDRIVLPSMAEHGAALIRHARTSYYPGIGHAPFLENPARFNADLAAFARR